MQDWGPCNRRQPTKHCKTTTPLHPAPPIRSRRSAASTVNHYHTTVVTAPPVAGGFGYGMPFFGGGFRFGFAPTFYMPIPFLGSILQFAFVMLLVSVVFNIVKVRDQWKNHETLNPALHGAATFGFCMTIYKTVHLAWNASFLRLPPSITLLHMQGFFGAAGGKKTRNDSDWDQL